VSADDLDVRVDISAHLMVITIDRPERRNAMTLAAATRIASAMDELDERADLSVGIITGAGGTFCAGMDLKRFMLGEVASIPGRGFAGVTQAPPRKPLIAAVEGYALGGGFELALACDLVTAGRDAVFGLSEVRRGLTARMGGLLLLPEKIPANIAKELALTGESITAPRAAELGLVNRVVDSGHALGAAIALGTVIADNAPLAVAATKRVLQESASWALHERWERQAAILNPVNERSEDAREGARAFAERRRPQWSGN
jgi:enoyl-CoA hydratase